MPLVQYNGFMRLILARGFIGVVILFNLQAAAVFLLWPARFTPGFELGGAVGEAMLRGLGMNLEEGLKLEQKLLGGLMGSDDFNEGIKAFLEKRKPDYRGK